MDRFDEKKPSHVDDVPVDRDDVARRDDPVREGDILGLGGSAVPKAPGDPSASDDPAAAAQRRSRMREGEASDSSRDEGTMDTFGSTSTDMGAGGTGNIIDRK
ncbi:hypothetical protein BH23ACI1_BH23ACI1_16740 [soil metagenome]